MKQKHSIEVFYITFPDKKAADTLCRGLIRDKKIACANILPINSIYFWQEKIQDDTEWVAICKTMPHLVDALMAEVESRHPYEVPCIWHFSVSANPAYAQWVAESVLED